MKDKLFSHGYKQQGTRKCDLRERSSSTAVGVTIAAADRKGWHHVPREMNRTAHAVHSTHAVHRAIHRAIHAIHAIHRAIHVVQTIHVHLKGRPLVATILAVVNLAAGKGGLLLDGADTLQGRVERREVDESHLLVLNDLDVLNLAKALEFLPEEEVVHVLIDTTDKHIASGPVLNRVEDLLGQRLWLSPANLDLAVLDNKAAGVGLAVEKLGRSGVDEGDEGTALLRQNLDGVNQTAVNMAENLV